MTTPAPDKRTERLAHIIRFALTLETRGLTSLFHATTAVHVARLIQLATLLNRRWRRNFRADDSQYQLHLERLQQTATEMNSILTVKADGGTVLITDSRNVSIKLAIPVWELT